MAWPTHARAPLAHRHRLLVQALEEAAGFRREIAIVGGRVALAPNHGATHRRIAVAGGAAVVGGRGDAAVGGRRVAAVGGRGAAAGHGGAAPGVVGGQGVAAAAIGGGDVPTAAVDSGARCT